MEKKPLISVIVPVYKTPEAYLGSCIKSVLDQSIQDYELILVDDGCPDTSGLICDQFAKQNSKIVVIHQKNAGVSAARNAGILHARGKYLTFLDSDDQLKPMAFETAVKAIQTHKTDCVIFGWEDFMPDGTTAHKVTEIETEIEAAEAVRQIASDNFLCGGGYPWNKLWDADALRGAYGKLPTFTNRVYTYEDKLWIIEALEKLHKVLLIPDVLYEYRFLPTSLTQNEAAWRKRQFNAYDAYDLILEQLKDKNPEAYRGAVRFYLCFCYYDLRNMYPYRHNDMERFQRTKKRLYSLCRSVKNKDLPNFKYKCARFLFLLFGRF